MKQRFSTFAAALLLLMNSLSLAAQPLAEPAAGAGAVAPAVRELIVGNLQKSRPSLTVDAVETTPVAGVYAVKVTHGPTLYVSADGRYFVLGDMFEITDGGYVNLAEQQRESMRAEKLADLKKEDMIIFSPEEQPARATIMVFTDVDCYYCQKLHREVPDLNLLGIEVRYLAFPRAGIGSESYRKIVSAWCAKDPQSALTKLKNRENIPSNQCPDNPVADEFKLGNAIGVNGTPAILTPEGKLMPGYVHVLQLAKVLGVEVDPQLATEILSRHPVQAR